MNQSAIIISLIVSSIISNFIGGIVSIYMGCILWVFPQTLFYSLEGIIEAWFLQEGLKLVVALYPLTVAITYYMITE